jgi:hypothetical protein
MRRKVRSLVCAWMVVVLDAAVPPYVVGVSGEREGAACRRSGEASEAEEVLSYWFPEDLADADMETLRRHG